MNQREQISSHTLNALAGPEAILDLAGVSKSFPGVKALDEVNFQLREGEVHALVGENGAGKSTLIKIASGVLRPDSGVVRVYGQDVTLESPRQAFVAGINVVHQELNLVPTFNVAENVMLEHITRRALEVVDRDEVCAEAQSIMDVVGLDVALDAPVERLSTGQQQMLEIAKALSSQAKIVLLDEPTASISLKDVDTLFEVIRRLQAEGISFVYVSHKLEEVFEIADRVTVLRDGRNAGETQPVENLNRDRLIQLMVGRSERVTHYPIRQVPRESFALEVKDLRGKHSLADNSFQLARGEILGWYGLIGSGRTELARVLVGADPATGGEISVDGEPADIGSVNEALHRWHIGYLTEDRNEDGLFLAHPITRNIGATVWDRLRNRLGLMDITAEERLARRYKEALDIRTPDLYQLVVNLSGGNRQKVNIAKGLATEPEILIVDEPTVGIDVKTKSEMHDLVWELAQEGISIILISSDMPEIIQLADRILVFRAGEIVRELPNTKDYEPMSNAIMDCAVAGSG